MPSSDNRLSISFESDFGGFRVEADENQTNIFNLIFLTKNRQHLDLGKYCSISDAVSAVAQQQTGYAGWDQLTSEELPHRVHNIAIWEFSQKEGTLHHAACSQ